VSLQVECYSGHTFAQRPTAFVWRGRRYQVEHVLKQWRSPQGPGFQLVTSGGEPFELIYDETHDRWSLKQGPKTTSIKGENKTMRDFVSERVHTVPPSGIRRFFDIAATMDDVISLGIGEPDFNAPEVAARAGAAALAGGDVHYTSNSGIIELRRAIADHVEALYGLRYDPETEILVTVGVSEALYLALTAVLDPGDEVVVPQPCFVAYASGVTLTGGVPVAVPTYVHERFQVTADAIEAAITPRSKALLIGYPNNPTGAVLSRERMTEIAAVAEAHDLLILSDEIYDRLVYGVTHTCFSSLPGMRERTIVLQGFSKAYAMTGFRVGYALAPAAVLAAMRKVHQYMIMSAPTIGQHTALAAITQAEEAVQEMVSRYDRRRKLIVNGLNEIGLTCFEPQGAFYAFPSIEVTGLDDEAFAETLLQEERVAVVPGSAFGESGRGFVRCSYATAYQQIEEALERMARFMRRHG
jgi:aminotransferase